MDYKYIEQLLERYWSCETSQEEESILRTFFRQEEVPAHLAKYQTLFEYEQKQKDITLGSDFDQKILTKIANKERDYKQTVIKAQRMTFNHRLQPLYRAAAVVSIFLLIGGAVQHTFERPNTPKGWDYNAANYQDTYMVPQEAFEVSMSGIEDIQDLLRTNSDFEDSLKFTDRK